MAEKVEVRRAGRPRNPVPRKRMVAEARIQFANAGFTGASMNSIATACGIRKASLFHHFTSKEALYLEVLGEVVTELSQLINQASQGNEEFLARLDQLGVLVVRYFGAHPGCAALLMREIIDQGPFMRGAGNQMVQMAMEMTAEFLRIGMNQGVIEEQDPLHLTMSIAGIHLLWFSADRVSESLAGGSVYSPQNIQQREESVTSQIRHLCRVC